MDIKNTKPPGSGPLPEPTNEALASSKEKSSFAETRSKLQSSAAGGLQPSSLAAVTLPGRTDLQDPAKLNQMVHALTSELINSAQNVTGPLSGDQKQFLSDFLSRDPLIRGEIESYLKKVVV